MYEAVDSAISQISSNCVEWWSSFVCSLRSDLFHEVFDSMIEAQYIYDWCPIHLWVMPNTSMIDTSMIDAQYIYDWYPIHLCMMPYMSMIDTQYIYDSCPIHLNLVQTWCKLGLTLVWTWSKPGLKSV